MKMAGLILSFLFLVNTCTVAQTTGSTVKGPIKEVKAGFAGSQIILVGDTELVLISDPKDATGNTFEINKEYKDLLIKKDAAFVLNPKYQGKAFKFTYAMNGKGWKCISNVAEVKLRKIKAKY